MLWIVARPGGLVTQCHNKVRDALGDLAAQGYRVLYVCYVIIRTLITHAPCNLLFCCY